MLYVLWFLCMSCLWLPAQEPLTIIGIGRLGLCTALCFEEAGYKVLGVDINTAYVNALNNKSFESHEPWVTTLLQKSSNFSATTSLDDGLKFSKIYYIMVDTPTTPSGQAYDHSKLNAILTEINKRKVKNKHIVIGCTVFPGYIRTTGSPLLADCEDTTISYNPEFVAQGSIIEGFKNPDIVLIGQGSSEIGDRLEKIYRKTCHNQPTLCRMSPESAEITKLAVNCFITTKIAYANMIGDIADSTPSADKYAILQAVGKDRRIGGLCLKPGYGFGGPCFPRDNRALGHYAHTIGIQAQIPQAVDTANALHTQYMVKQFLAENKDTYTFTNVAYKENCAVPIIEESQKLAVAAALAKQGKQVIISDIPPVIEQVKNTFGTLFTYHTK